MKYLLGIGTNLGDKRENIDWCINAINLAPYTDVLKRSGIYETEPVGYARQDNFLNCVLLVESQFEPAEMLGLCIGIECGRGRKRGIVNGPRVLDIDLLYAEDKRINTRNLTVPHPRIKERRFVIAPLMDLYPDGVAFGFNFAKNVNNIDGQLVTKIEELENFNID